MKNKNQYSIELLSPIADIQLEQNVDVIVKFEDGEQFSATFFTIDNIKALMNSYSTTGECHRGLYFWCVNMIIVRELSRRSVEETIQSLIDSEEFEQVFSKIQRGNPG